MELLLWRHADALDARPGQDDLDRPLSDEGERQAALIGRWLAQALPADALILVSPALRTRQTVRVLGRPVQTVPDIGPGAAPKALLHAAGWPRAGGTVLLVGHQPTLGLLVSRLLGGSEQHWRVPRASVWWLAHRHDGHADLVTMRSPERP